MDTKDDENQPCMDSDIIEIEPIEDYNVQKAKLRASLLWLLHKAYGHDIPGELQGLFYETAEGALHLLPRLLNLLVSGEVYCQACSALFRDTAYQWQGHWSIIQVLSRKGIYVMETEDVAVTATVLTQTAPFRVNAHLALIDALMTAQSSDVFSIPGVVQAVRRFTTFNASSELPSTLDDAVLFWMNKVCSTLVHRQEEERKAHEQQLIQGETTQKVRITRKQLSPKEFPVIESMKDLVEDITDGCSLAATISFYCPHHLKLSDICLKRNIGIADSLFNLRLVKTFCETQLPAKCFHFEYVDLLYCHESLRQNVMALLAELFYSFEIQKADCVSQGSRPSTAARLTSAVKTPVPISEATKKSFHKSHNEESRSSPLDFTRVPQSPTSNIPARQVLLPKRANQEDISQQEAAGYRPGQSTHHSILAWQEDGPIVPPERRPGRKPAPAGLHQRDHRLIFSEQVPGVSQSQGSNLLANVSIDSEILDSCRSVDLDGLGESLDIDAGANLSTSPQQHHRLSPSKDSDNVEMLSISSSGNSTQMSEQMGLRSSVHSVKGDPLLPARIKAAKEKNSNHSKAEERGDMSSRKPSNPTVRKIRLLPKPPSPVESTEFSPRVSSDSSGSSPEDMVVTPLPEEQMSLEFQPSAPPSHSYTIPDAVSTRQAAVAAGIPVVSDSHDVCEPSFVTEVQKRSRQSSVTSNRSSGDFSDHESQKIHLDHKSRESAIPKEMSPMRTSQSTDVRPDTLPMGKPEIESSDHKTPLIITDEGRKNVHKTSFAQIKKLQDGGQYENSGFVFMQHGQESNGNGGNKMSLKAAFQRKQAEGSGNKAEKKTTFATLPNQTTWQQNAQRMQMAGSSSAQTMENGDSAQPLASELQHVRKKLEEKRRMIEREKHKMELQKSKQRQRLGKAAFLQVLSKRDGKENSIQEQPEVQMTRSAEGRVSPLQAPLSSMSSSQPNYNETLVETDQPSAGLAKTTRTFSREDIQNTIENVRKRWFGDQNGDYHRPDHSSTTTAGTTVQSHHQQQRVVEAPGPAQSQGLGRVTPPQESRSTRPLEMREAPSPHTRTTPPLDMRATPPLDTRATPPLEARATPPMDTRMTPPLDATRSSPVQREQLQGRVERPARSTPPPTQQPDSALGRRTTPPLEKHTPSPPIAIRSSPRNTPPLGKEGGKDTENYDEYNSSLDKLNHSLSELQGEIMRLSLKQEQLKKSPPDPVGPVISPAQSLNLAGPNVVQHTRAPPPASLWQGPPVMKGAAQTDSSGPPVSYPPGTQTFASPPALRPASQQGPPAPFVMHGQPPTNYPASAAYTSPNQYAPGGYIPPQPPFSLQSPPMYPQLYQQSQPYSAQAGAAPFIMHMHGPSTQSYLPSSLPGAPYQPPAPGTGYQPHPQYNGTYTVASHSHPHSASGSGSAPVLRPPNPTFQNSAENVNSNLYSGPTLSEERIPAAGSSAADANLDSAMAAVRLDGHSCEGTSVHSGSNEQQVNPNALYQTPEGHTLSQEDPSSAGANEGFFISFGEETPKRPKPKLGKERNKEDAPAKALVMERPETPRKMDNTLNTSAQSASPASDHNQSDANSSGIGFVIGEDNTSISKSLEDEMQRKREKVIQLQQKRREEQERKRLEKEQAEAEKKEKERRKQEEAEQRKLDERARRDAIFQKYKERKAREDQEEPAEEVRPRKDRSHDRQRPKSMIVKTRTPIQQNGGPVRAGNSHDDLHASSSRDLATPSPVPPGRLTPKRGKLYRPASCHLMDTVDGDPRTALPFGSNMTHRRPPSPDLYARFQQRKASSARGADNNSETGSAHGSDYAGPKLYVKPSQKSNRHIIANAISHVCLAGTVNTDLKNKVLEEMGRSEGKHFMILFRSAGCQFRGLYMFDPETEFTFKVTGAGPRQLTNKDIETFYKYNSGAKKFNIVASTKHLSVSIDAIVAHNSVWKTAKQSSARR